MATDTDEEDLEGSTEADTGELSRCKPHLIESVSIGTTRRKGNKFEGRKHEVDNSIENHLDDIKEECSGTEEGQQLLSAMRKKFDVEANESKVSRSPMLNKSKKVLFGRGVVFGYLHIYHFNSCLLNHSVTVTWIADFTPSGLLVNINYSPGP